MTRFTSSTRSVFGLTIVGVVLALMLSEPKGPATCMDSSIVALGSTALQPLVEAAAKAYMTKCPAAKINVQGGGSGTGLTQVLQGGATIGDSDIFAEQASGVDAKQIVDHQAVVQGFAIAANPSVKVTSLTADQVLSIWTGKVTNWKDVGGNDQKITIINRPTSSGTRATFKKYALKGATEAQGVALTEDSTGAVAKAINDTPGAIGYLGLAYFLTNKDLKQIQYNGKAPTVANISDDSYPIWSYGHMYTKGEATGLAKAFIDYILSDDIQTTLVPQLGYIPATQVKAKHTP
ncbi:MAG: phosphate ABC transporter substrate-binding protein PstS family protein [Thermomicrobia bacterium]|nr:phosphate ABC transporter substrate-binding protein PstS family protein [Thermomicrobia bacterium]